MLRPIGNLPPAIYWRRRAWFAAGVVAVIALLVWAFGGGGGGGAKAGARVAAAPPTATPAATSPASPKSTDRTKSTKSTKPRRSGSTRSSGSSAAVKTCQLADLAVTAVTDKRSYPRTAQPVLAMQVVNVGTTPCAQNLADSQIELRVYTGNVRFWGSHDCGIHSQTDLTTLLPDQPARRGVLWSGHTSQPGCTGTALSVEPGTYTLIASLAKQSSIPVAFTITK